jgi:UDP-3-O-acyl N-acetylglucosamine deacetylase
MEKQRTLAKEVFLEGIGLHTGNKTKITFCPAPLGFGIQFRRVDLPGRPLVPANHSYVLGSIRGTTIGTDSIRIHTVEHILAVCSMFGIDNLEIQVTNNEPPVFDGSARELTELFAATGYTEQDRQRTYLSIPGPVIYENKGTRLAAYPSDTFSIDCTVQYNHPYLHEQKASYTLNWEVFRTELASARTFCFDYEIEALKAKGLAKGGDLTNAIVIGLTGIHNPDKKLRYENEFVRHKILDFIGDIYLLGSPLKARIEAFKPGHNHNINFAKELAKQLVTVQSA